MDTLRNLVDALIALISVVAGARLVFIGFEMATNPEADRGRAKQKARNVIVVLIIALSITGIRVMLQQYFSGSINGGTGDQPFTPPAVEGGPGGNEDLIN